ncbi:hypothetical protein KIM322_05610 [Lactobacillus xylocopicola]|uniref:Uncharacterized protein n=1 Tax=Lactobacillus xylocopicola TaxID=2976676 RepID=A0ABN6SIZ3_9LACO|nr:hypothetical protein KIM322_05610 [Lactobacillus xylocopicola]
MRIPITEQATHIKKMISSMLMVSVPVDTPSTLAKMKAMGKEKRP